MPIDHTKIPVSLYIHLPWCIRKCPYCDFNSHELKQQLPEKAYVEALIHEADIHSLLLGGRIVNSIFIGGGTPSLFSDRAIFDLIRGLRLRYTLHDQCEITLEANPGTVDLAYFEGYRRAGVNRISLGAQSFNQKHLQRLGRIHHSSESTMAVKLAQRVGFEQINVDIMYGLPDQTVEEGLQDLQAAMSLKPDHLSWYQLTLEPNTRFYNEKPTLPNDDVMENLYQQGIELIQSYEFSQYEVSAFSQPGAQCLHNLNYWSFGDYLGLGAGAHSKITLKDGSVVRFQQAKHPRAYLNREIRESIQKKALTKSDLSFEFMLNALRLVDGIPKKILLERTGILDDALQDKIQQAEEKGLLEKSPVLFKATPLGKRFLNDLTAIFLS